MGGDVVIPWLERAVGNDDFVRNGAAPEGECPSRSLPRKGADCGYLSGGGFGAILLDGVTNLFEPDAILLGELKLEDAMVGVDSSGFDPANSLHARDMSVTLSGRNLLLWTKYRGVDPEVTNTGRQTGNNADNFFQENVDSFGLPIPRRIGLSVRLGY